MEDTAMRANLHHCAGFDSADRFCGKITALFLPHLAEDIPDEEWLLLQGKIAACFMEFMKAGISAKQPEPRAAAFL